LNELLLGMVDMLTFPSGGVFPLRLPLSQKLSGFGVAIDDLRVFLGVTAFTHVALSFHCGIQHGCWFPLGLGLVNLGPGGANSSLVRDGEPLNFWLDSGRQQN
jgi:hypothetical protein